MIQWRIFDKVGITLTDVTPLSKTIVPIRVGQSATWEEGGGPVKAELVYFRAKLSSCWQKNALALIPKPVAASVSLGSAAASACVRPNGIADLFGRQISFLARKSRGQVHCERHEMKR